MALEEALPFLEILQPQLPANFRKSFTIVNEVRAVIAKEKAAIAKAKQAAAERKRGAVS